MVVEFVVQSENAENISEALLKWCPAYFMTDYSVAELVALEEVFPTSTVYLCDFISTGNKRWVKDKKQKTHVSVVVPGPLFLMVIIPLVIPLVRTSHQ